jgi:hypothetical protein
VKLGRAGAHGQEREGQVQGRERGRCLHRLVCLSEDVPWWGVVGFMALCREVAQELLVLDAGVGEQNALTYLAPPYPLFGRHYQWHAGTSGSHGISPPKSLATYLAGALQTTAQCS